MNGTLTERIQFFMGKRYALSLRARLPLRGLYTKETGGDMLQPLCSGSYNRLSSGVSCPFASMVLESVAVSLAKPGFDHGYPV